MIQTSHERISPTTGLKRECSDLAASFRVSKARASWLSSQAGRAQGAIMKPRSCVVFNAALLCSRSVHHSQANLALTPSACITPPCFQIHGLTLISRGVLSETFRGAELLDTCVRGTAVRATFQGKSQRSRTRGPCKRSFSHLAACTLEIEKEARTVLHNSVDPFRRDNFSYHGQRL